MNTLNKNPLVCVFDSGIGGLNLLYECVALNPTTDFLYFADNYRVPYGSLNKKTLSSYVFEIFEKINATSPQAVVVACNTVTAECIEELRAKYSFEIIGIQPAIKPAILNCGKCTILSTPATAQSESLKNLIANFGEEKSEVVACPTLASFIEENISNISEKEVCALLPDISPQSVVLGCTHYIFIEEIIKKRYNCPIFDGTKGTADHLAKILGNGDHSAKRAQKVVFCTGNTQKNRDIWRLILKQKELIP
jgi:glutamate racemase